MNQEFPRRPLLAGADVGSTGNSITTFFANPFAGISTNSDRRRILTDGGDAAGGDASEAPVTRDCGYSRPFLFLDMIWNMAFVVVSVFVLLVTVQERPLTPLRLWVCGYALQSLLHVGFVWDEYQTRNLDEYADDDDEDDSGGGGGGGGGQDFHFQRVSSFSGLFQKSIIKKLESINSIVSSVWWVFGFYWVVIGGQPLLQESPRLYWLSVIFLAFDVFFMIFCIVMACVVFLLMFCCFPILATVAYAMTIKDGASENDIRLLPKYFYRHQNTLPSFHNNNNKKDEFISSAVPANSNSKPELVLHPDDSECCICLYKYVDGAELCALPCNHHFHHKCITKWLRINATCPLCKFNILRGGDMLV